MSYTIKCDYLSKRLVVIMQVFSLRSNLFINFSTMKSSLYTSLLFLFTVTNIVSQETWQNHNAISFLREADRFEDKLYICAIGGEALLTIDLVTKEENVISTLNSNFTGTGTRELEILDNGHMWLTGNFGEGIFYYDGQSFTHYDQYQNNDTLVWPRDMVANDKVVWFRTGNQISSSSSMGRKENYGDLYSIRDKVFTNHIEDFPLGVDAFTLDDEGTFWVVYDGSIHQYDGENLSNSISIPFFEAYKTFPREYMIDSDGTHWLSVYYDESRTYELWSYKSGQWEFNELPGYTRALYEDPSNDIAINMSRYFGFKKDGVIQYDSIPLLFPQLPEARTTMEIKYYEEDLGYFVESDNYTGQHQLYWVSDQGTDAFFKNESFFVPSVRSIAQGCDGQIFATGYGVVQEYKDASWKNHYPRETLSFCNVGMLLTTNPYTCEVWGYSSSFSCGTLWRFDDDEVFDVSISPEGGEEAVFDSIGNLYLSASQEVFHIDTVGRLTRFNSQNSPVSDPIDLLIASDQSLWVLDYPYTSFFFVGDSIFGEENILHFKDGVWNTYSDLLDINSYYSNIRGMLYEDSQGRVWANSQNKLLEFDGTSWIEHVFDYQINDIVEDQKGNFWLATSGKGLGYWDGVETTFYDVVNSGLASNNCYDLELVDNKELWINHSYSLTQMQIDQVLSSQDVNETKKSYTIYPNPTSGEFNIRNEAAVQRTYEVYTMSGELVFSDQSNDSIWSAYLKPGAYVVKMRSEDGDYVERLIVAK